VKTFKDWAGQEIPYRFVPSEEPNEIVCEVNPHGDAWHPMGRARTQEKALALAVSGWNVYDKQP
jgi:hypothetical protein